MSPMIVEVEEARLRRGMIGLGLFGPVVFTFLMCFGRLLDEEEAFLLPGMCLSLLMYATLGASVIGMPIYLGARWRDPGPKDRVMIALLLMNLGILVWITCILVPSAWKFLD